MKFADFTNSHKKMMIKETFSNWNVNQWNFSVYFVFSLVSAAAINSSRLLTLLSHKQRRIRWSHDYYNTNKKTPERHTRMKME